MEQRRLLPLLEHGTRNDAENGSRLAQRGAEDDRPIHDRLPMKLAALEPRRRKKKKHSHQKQALLYPSVLPRTTYPVLTERHRRGSDTVFEQTFEPSEIIRRFPSRGLQPLYPIREQSGESLAGTDQGNNASVPIQKAHKEYPLLGRPADAVGSRPPTTKRKSETKEAIPQQQPQPQQQQQPQKQPQQQQRQQQPQQQPQQQLKPPQDEIRIQERGQYAIITKGPYRTSIPIEFARSRKEVEMAIEQAIEEETLRMKKSKKLNVAPVDSSSGAVLWKTQTNV